MIMDEDDKAHFHPLGSGDRSELKPSLGRKSGVGLGLLMVVLSLIWSATFVKYKLDVREIENHMTQFRAEAAEAAYQQLDMRGTLPALHELKLAASVMDQQSLPWMASLGLYDRSVDDEANEAYDRELLRHFLALMIVTLEKNIQLADEGRHLYNTFRVYLMFNRLDTLNKEEVQSWFRAFWETTIKADDTKRAELETHLAHLLTLELTSVELNHALVNNVREIILKEPIAKQIYSRIRYTPSYARKVDMLDEMGDKARQYFVINPQLLEASQIPVLYTKAGYEKVDLSADSDIIKAVIRDRSELARADAGKDLINYTQEDTAKISEQLKALYFSDYIRAWSGFYQSLNLVPLGDVRHAEHMLAALTDPVYSPIVVALEVGAKNTKLTPEFIFEPADTKACCCWGSARKDCIDKVIGGNWVDRYFMHINYITQIPKFGQPQIGEALDKLRDLRAFVAEIALVPDIEQTSGSNPATALRLISPPLNSTHPCKSPTLNYCWINTRSTPTRRKKPPF
jgi:type VI secretion system protein ImpL